MNFSIAVPQIFYDLIARVLPGFFFLVFIKMLFVDMDISIELFSKTESDNFVTSLGNGLGYFFVFYLFGWLLHAFRLFSFRSKYKARYEENVSKNNSYSSRPLTLNDMYQMIRVRNPEAGFRIVKLRAEARMIESTRTGMALIMAFVIVVFCLVKFQVYQLPQLSAMGWATRFLLPFIIFFGLLILEGPAWKRYYENIYDLFQVIFIDNAKEATTESSHL